LDGKGWNADMVNRWSRG